MEEEGRGIEAIEEIEKIEEIEEIEDKRVMYEKKTFSLYILPH